MGRKSPTKGQGGDVEDYALEREVEDVLAVVEAVEEPFTLLGHSLGANIALEASLRTGNIDKLILYEPGIAVGEHEFSSDEVIDEMNNLLDEGKNEQALLLFCSDIAGLLPDEINTFRSAPGWQDRVDGAHTLPREEQAIAEYKLRPSRFANMTMPTLLLSGGESPQLYRDATQAVHKALPNSRISTFEGQQHVAMNNEPERFISEVLAFVFE